MSRRVNTDEASDLGAKKIRGMKLERTLTENNVQRQRQRTFFDVAVPEKGQPNTSILGSSQPTTLIHLPCPHGA